MTTEKKDLTKKNEMAKILYNIDALKFGVFKLTSGKASPYYIDLRVVPSFPDAFRQICDFYGESITREVGLKNFDRIAGIPLAGIPFASRPPPYLLLVASRRLHADPTIVPQPVCYTHLWRIALTVAA